jgi:hypothetical protein
MLVGGLTFIGFILFYAVGCFDYWFGDMAGRKFAGYRKFVDEITED